MKTKFLVAFLALLLSAQNLSGQNPQPAPSDLKGNVNQGTSPDDWLAGLKKANEGKWNEVDSVSGAMAQILQAVTDAIAEQWNTNRDPCKQAAAGIGYSVVFDAYGSAGLNALLGGLKGAISDILTLGEGKIGELLKEKGKEGLKDLIKEKLSKQKPEVYIAEVTKANCKVKLVAIWDKAAGTYEVLVYGDCKCNLIATGSIRGSVALRTFAIRAKGNVSIDIDSTKQVPILVVGQPKVTIDANCGCAKGTTGTTPQPGGPGTTPQPGPGGTTPQPEGPGGGTTPQPPQDVSELCKQKPPCKECMPIYNRIVAGCKRIEEIDRELRDLAGEHDGNANRQAAVQGEIAQLQKQGAAAADQLQAKQQELQILQREARNIEINARNLGVERQGLEGKLRDLAKQMKECEKTRCGTGKIIELPPEGTAAGPGKAPAPPEQPKTPPKSESNTPQTTPTPSGESPQKPAEQPVPVPKGAILKSSLIGVVLPTDRKPGETVSGRVVANPDDYAQNPAFEVVRMQVPLEQQENGRASLHGVVVDTGNGQRQPADGVIKLAVPAATTVISLLVGREDTETTERQQVPATPATPHAEPPVQSTGQPTDYQMPPVCIPGSTQVVHGPFTGDAGLTHVEVNDQPATILAETPRAVYWQVPQSKPGPVRVSVRDEDRGANFQPYVLALTMSADQLQLMRGQSTSFHVSVTGMENVPASVWRAGGSPQAVDLETARRVAPDVRPPAPGEAGFLLLTIENTSKDTITIQGSRNARGEVVVLKLKQADFAGVPYRYDGVIHSKRSGGFDISGTLVPFLAPLAGQPPK